MSQKKTRSDPYAAHGRSIVPRVVLTTSLAACVAVAWILLLGGAIHLAGLWTGRSWHAGEEGRRLCLGVALTVYFIRLLFTQFVFLRRAMGWGEAAMIGGWVLCIYIVLAAAGGTNPARFGKAGAFGAGLFVVGSWMNSYAEYERHRWKQRAENRGRLYTQGLFRYSRHPNYLGDLISFSGLCVMAGRWETFAIPAIMLAGFVFANIPMLDAHLLDHYGAAFDAYAARTRKLIPFLY